MLVFQVIIVLLIGSVLSTPLDEYRSLMNEAELSKDYDKYRMSIIPSGFLQQSHKEINPTPEVANDNNEYYKIFNLFVKNGTTEKGLTFNIYDDNMRAAAIALFRYFQTLDIDDYEKFLNWADNNINRDLLSYAVKLNYLYSPTLDRKEITQTPCYIEKPNYFINSDVVLKALRVRLALNSRGDLPSESKVHQFYQLHSMIVMNTNYSGWNLPHNGGEEDLNYFREDIALNCYYLGIHLLHPFWMSNDELDQLNQRHAEHYYYSHQQLMARYILEKEHLKQQNKISDKVIGESDYNPYLVYDNGLPFPVRSAIQNNWNDDRATLKVIVLAIHECISRGLIIMDNGKIMNMTSDSDINLLAKLIRANLDSVNVAKIIRSLFGCGPNNCPVTQYNPAPSVLHHPETSLRDPFYWQMINFVLKYFMDFKSIAGPFDISQYETDEFILIDKNFSKIVTYFDYYQFPINRVIDHQKNHLSKGWPIFARQRRLKYLPFSLNFTVESSIEKNVIVRLFLGPSCRDNCWKEYSKFYELDSFIYLLQNKSNIISWSPEKSMRLSFYNDDIRNDYYNFFNKLSTQKKKYSMFKFPGDLLIPHGTSEGLSLKLFIMITSAEDLSEMENTFETDYYKRVSFELDTKPLGFPFHRIATGYKMNASNFKFYDIKIYHYHYPVDKNDYFSHNLY